jgi:FkbM family methyltransferase
MNFQLASAKCLSRRTSCRHGLFYVLKSDTVLGRSMTMYGEWAEPEVAMLTSYLRPSDNVIDVGANIGTHTIPFARAVGQSGAVFSFEPQPMLYDLLAANVAQNEIDNIRLFCFGCGASASIAQLPDLDYAKSANYGAVELRPRRYDKDGNAVACEKVVNVVPLDERVHVERVRLIKIDTEGMEIDVLCGAAALIERCQPVLYVENEQPASSPALLLHLKAWGYTLYWHAVPLFNPANHRGETRNVFATAHCINNLCLPSGWQGPRPALDEVKDLDEHPRLRLATQVNALNIRTADVLFRRACEAERKGNHDEAIGLLEKALRLHPGYYEARQRFEALRKA